MIYIIVMVLVCANSWNTLPVVSRTILYIIQASTAEMKLVLRVPYRSGVAQAHSEQGKLEVSSDI